MKTMATNRRTWHGSAPDMKNLSNMLSPAEDEPHVYLQLTGKRATTKDKLHPKGVVDMDPDDLVHHSGGGPGGQSLRGYSGQPRWSGQSSSPSSPVSPVSPTSLTSSSRPPSYKSNPPMPPGASPVEDYMAPQTYNEYEELPNLRYNNPNYRYHEVAGVVPETRRPSPGTSSHLSPMNHSTENLCQMNNSIHDKPQPPSFRRRQNPLYEEKQAENEKKGKTEIVSSSYILCLLLIVGIVATAALILVILDLSGVIGRNRSYISDDSVLYPDNSTDARVMVHRLKDLESRYAKLEKFAENYAALEMLLSQHGLNLTRIENRLQKFGLDITTFNASVKQELAEIRKMPGPRGPAGLQGPKGEPGVGNLTRCRYRDLSRGSRIDQPATSTAWTPDTKDMRDWVIMGLECSTTGGNTAMLRVQPHPDNSASSQFMCHCGGQESGATARFCYIHVFECPRIS